MSVCFRRYYELCGKSCISQLTYSYYVSSALPRLHQSFITVSILLVNHISETYDKFQRKHIYYETQSLPLISLLYPTFARFIALHFSDLIFSISLHSFITNYTILIETATLNAKQCGYIVQKPEKWQREVLFI